MIRPFSAESGKGSKRMTSLKMWNGELWLFFQEVIGSLCWAMNGVVEESTILRYLNTVSEEKAQASRHTCSQSHLISVSSDLFVSAAGFFNGFSSFQFLGHELGKWNVL